MGASGKQKVAEAATKLFGERGYEAVSPRDIQKAAGVGQGSFYHHFGSKLALASHALEAIAGEMKKEADAILGPDNPVEGLRRYITRPRHGQRGCRLGRFAYEGIIREKAAREPVTDYFDYVGERLVSLMENARAQGSLSKKVNAEHMATALMATVQGAYVLARVYQDDKRLKYAMDGLLELFEMAVLSGRRPAAKSSGRRK